jgi:hypothetical protein
VNHLISAEIARVNECLAHVDAPAPAAVS